MFQSFFMFIFFSIMYGTKSNKMLRLAAALGFAIGVRAAAPPRTGRALLGVEEAEISSDGSVRLQGQEQVVHTSKSKSKTKKRRARHDDGPFETIT